MPSGLRADARKVCLGHCSGLVLGCRCRSNSFVALARFGGDVLPEARKNWLFRVVHRESLRIREKQSRYHAMPSDSDLIREPTATYESNPISKILHDEEIEKLKRKIKELSPEQQQVLHMRIFEDKTFAEISTQLSIPIGTALSRMRLPWKDCVQARTTISTKVFFRDFKAIHTSKS